MIRFKKIEGNVSKRIPRLIKEYLQDGNIISFFLFGSYADNKIRPLSDVDIAVLLKGDISLRRYFDYKLDLLSRAVRTLKTEEIDLVLLNEAPYDLAYNILKNGKILFCRDKKAQADFQEKIVLRYLDVRPLKEEVFAHLKERIKSGVFAYD